jgi:Zn ribbon nucleic-acid-binding protein
MEYSRLDYPVCPSCGAVDVIVMIDNDTGEIILVCYECGYDESE